MADFRISYRAGARHLGVTLRAVQNAIAKRRLVESIGRDAQGRPFITSLETLEREWRSNGDRTRATVAVKERESRRGAPDDAPSSPESSPSSSMTIAEATAFEKTMKGKLAELAYLEKAGKLVDAEAAARTWIEVVTRSRTKLLGLPSKLKTRLPHLTPADLRAIDAEVRQMLEELATGDAAEGAA